MACRSATSRVVFVAVLLVHPATTRPSSCPPPKEFLDRSSPPRVARPGLAYDTRRGVTVLFGGVTDEGRHLGTWEWDGRRWKEDTIPGPSPRTSHGMVYDSRRSVMIVFGGTGVDGQPLGDTWEFDGVTWRPVRTSGPSPREAFGMAYDSARGEVVLFGGFGTNSTAPYSDTWLYSSHTWRRTLGRGPSGTTFHRMAYDAARARVVSFGGRGDGGGTWEWDGVGWTQVSRTGPPPRDHHAMAYDPHRQQVLIFGGGRQLPSGGYDRSNLWLTDLWAWDGRAWTELAPTGPATSRGGQPGMAYDTRRERLILFGGGGLEGTWEWDRQCWSRMD